MALNKHLIQTSKLLLIETSLSYTFPYIRIPKSPREEILITFEPNKSLKDLKEFLISKFDIKDARFYALDGSKYSLNTSSVDAILDPMIIELDNGSRFSVFSLNSERTNLTSEQRSLSKHYEEDYNMPHETAEVLACINYFMNRELENYSDSINIETFNSIAKSSVLLWANQIRLEQNSLRSHIEVMKKNFEWEFQQKDEIEKRAGRHVNRVLWGFFSVIAAQFTVIQYGTYHLYSWDIMEPITCMMTMGDLCVGYVFWMLAGHRDYGMNGISDYFYQRKLRKLYRKKRINQEEMTNVVTVIKDLENRISLLK